MNKLAVTDIGRSKYGDAWTLQQKLFEFRHFGLVGDMLLYTEHEHVYTIGKGGDENHLLATESELKGSGVEVYRIDRGGDITYHGPGQIVGYPIIDLNNYFADIHRYLRCLEEVIIIALNSYGIEAVREPEFTGVWVNGEKIAAIGVKVSRWITMHGFALNVATDLLKFDRIIPCGIFHKGVTSMERILGERVSSDDVRDRLTEAFGHVFGCEATVVSPGALEERVRTFELGQLNHAENKL
ncbi:MAG: lipoyl(octanoyl) transferase LipB [Ignavibacteriales bacterium]|nr:lipoyl(octanoyl) transferase LipB [Ignavibacteriales bacterium]